MLLGRQSDSRLKYLPGVEGVAESDVDVVFEHVGVTLDALWKGGGAGVGQRVVEEPAEVGIVHALRMCE